MITHLPSTEACAYWIVWLLGYAAINRSRSGRFNLGGFIEAVWVVGGVAFYGWKFSADMHAAMASMNDLSPTSEFLIAVARWMVASKGRRRNSAVPAAHMTRTTMFVALRPQNGKR